MRRLLVAALLAGGCSAADPCDGLSGSCISARVEGSVTGIEQLAVYFDDSSQMVHMMSSAPGGRFDLPARLAILLPASATSPATLGIDALAGGQVIGATGPTTVPFTPNAKTPFTFTLRGGGGDGGPGDGGPGDGSPGDGPPPGVVSFNPPLLDFGKINRGVTSAQQTTTLVNNTSHTVTGTANATMTPTDPFKFLNVPPCLSGPMGQTVTLAAGQSCGLTFAFAPTLLGKYKQDVTAALDDGEMVGFSTVGEGLPVWAAENGSMSTTFNAVWASGSNDWYAVANDSSGGLFHSDGRGSWTHLNATTLSNNCFSVYGLDATKVWFGCDMGRIYVGSGTNNPSLLGTPNATSLIRGLYGFPALGGFAVPDITPNEWWATDVNGNFFKSYAPNSGTFSMRGLCGTTTRAVSVGASGTWYVKDANDNLWSQYGLGGGTMPPYITNYTPNLNGCWMPDDSNLWVVGDAPSSGSPGLIFHCTGTGLNTCNLETPPVNNSLSAISGRRVPNSTRFDIYAVGGLGNVVLHSDGGGTWTTVPVPNNQAMIGVFVLPTGDVAAVGFNGQVNHLY